MIDNFADIEGYPITCTEEDVNEVKDKVLKYFERILSENKKLKRKLARIFLQSRFILR